MVAARLPQIDLADVLIDVDAWTHFSDELTHAHGATPRQPRLREHRYAALLAHACNLGYARMGQAARIDSRQLAWITQWYLRPEALAAANARIVNAHDTLALAQEWGDGRFSSSDGKRYPVGVDSPEARAVSRYFGRGRGVTFYVWTSDQHTHYATRVVRTTVRDVTYVTASWTTRPSCRSRSTQPTQPTTRTSSSRSSTSSACSSRPVSPDCPTAASSRPARSRTRRRAVWSRTR